MAFWEMRSSWSWLSLLRVSITGNCGLEMLSIPRARGTALRMLTSPYCRKWSRMRKAIWLLIDSPMEIMAIPRTATSWCILSKGSGFFLSESSLFCSPSFFSSSWSSSVSLKCSLHSDWSFWISRMLEVPTYAQVCTVTSKYFLIGCSIALMAARIPSHASPLPRNSKPMPRHIIRATESRRSVSDLSRKPSMIEPDTSSLAVPTKMSPRAKQVKDTISMFWVSSTMRGVRMSKTSSRAEPA
mmetsp:Transcript_27908/g.39396  ORF Transcript_27908/g.39396 Transcript_27908/m.39396 type:complete len:242 (-) Transcript_27908:1496-2221(-)